MLLGSTGLLVRDEAQPWEDLCAFTKTAFHLSQLPLHAGHGGLLQRQKGTRSDRELGVDAAPRSAGSLGLAPCGVPRLCPGDRE